VAGSEKRSRLIEAAAKLVYERGFANTALSDIAREADVPLGNIYYYFKTKAEIGEAIIAQQLAAFESQKLGWDRAETPKARLRAFIQMTIDNRDMLARGGCPVGSLCSELHKGDGMLVESASRPFAALLSWIESQFEALGKRKEKRALALHLLSALQGVSLLANNFHDPDMVILEGDHLKAWIGELEASAGAEMFGRQVDIETSP
jgi:TetR/AcrR family transcriptional regulator, transcriptional repressor for nem operon